MKNSKKIILAAGGTGGHFYPAIALAEELKRSENQVHLFTDLRCKQFIDENMPIIPYISKLHINMSGIKSKIISLCQLFLECVKTFFHFLKLKPSIVVGFGGYPSFPSLLAASILNIPLVIHEQNCYLGKSNKIFAKFAKFIAISYKETKNLPEKYSNKIIYTGDVVRQSILNLPVKKDFTSKTFHLFIFGGSQGASFITEIMPDTLSIVKKSISDLKVTQQVAKEKVEEISSIYKELQIDHEIKSFFHNISDIYKDTDLVISRSGASTIAELSSIGLPAIFIPFPYAKEEHQMHNAKALADQGASWYYKQQDISPDILAEKIIEIINNRNLLAKTSKQLLKRRSDGARHLADTVLKIIA